MITKTQTTIIAMTKKYMNYTYYQTKTTALE